MNITTIFKTQREAVGKGRTLFLKKGRVFDRTNLSQQFTPSKYGALACRPQAVGRRPYGPHSDTPHPRPRSAPGNRNSSHFSGDEDEVVLPWCTSSQRRGCLGWGKLHLLIDTIKHIHYASVFPSKCQNAFEKQLVILALVAIVGLFAVRDVISLKQLREWLQSNITHSP